MIFNHPFRVRHPEHASKFELSRLRLGKHRTVSAMGTKFLRASHKRVFHRRPPTASPTDTHLHCDFRRSRQSKRHDQSTGKDPVYSLVDVLYTQTFAKDQIEDTREHAHLNNFRRHSRTHFQWNCDPTDCHPFFSVYTFDHDSAAAPAVVFKGSVPETTYRFPCDWGVFVLLDYVPCRCAHEVVDVRDRCGSTSFPP